jgi:hypothetical protein
MKKKIPDERQLSLRITCMQCLAFLLLALTAALYTNNVIAANLIFSDDFSGSALDPSWQVLPGKGSFSLVAGNLRYSNEGLSSPSGTWPASLVLALPFIGTNWEIDIKAKYSLDWALSGSYTGPAVLNHVNSSGAQRDYAMVSFDAVAAGDRSALDGSNYAQFQRGVDAWYGENSFMASYGSVSTYLPLNPANAGIVDNIADGDYWLQFIRNEGNLSLKYSYDGVNYLSAVSASLANPASSYNELLLTGNTFFTVGSFADYDYVHISNTVPEPDPWCLLGTGLVILPWAVHRLKACKRM